jgi:Rad3-related DNA helicase
MVKDELVLRGFHHETETRRDRHAAVAERKAKIEARTFDSKPHVLHAVIGGSYSEGMDFRNNPLKLIVLAGFPYPKPDARHEAYEGYLAGKFRSSSRASELASVLPGCIKSVQAMGRGIRKADDWCYCLLIDDRFEKYRGYYQPAMSSSAEAIAGSQKKRIYEDISHFIEQMGVNHQGD